MTFPLAAFTIGAILIYTAFKGASVGELLRGETDGTESKNFFNISGGSAGKRSSGGASPVLPSGDNSFKKTVGVVEWTNPDGSKKQVAGWIYSYLRVIGAAGKVTLSSGWRDPAYSEKLCFEMCGAPSCPGKCAGKSSNHSGKVYPEGAIDVVNYDVLDKLIAKAAKKGVPRVLKNGLPSTDRVHYSHSGN